jgi:hypothetical protein
MCTMCRVLSLTISAHAEFETFLQSTVLTPITIHPVNDAVLLSWTLIVCDGRLTASEEALAAFARDDAIVYTGRLIAAHFARNHFDLCCKEYIVTCEW